MRTGADEEGGSTKFLEQVYTIWDRKFGDPRLLADDRARVSLEYDGKLSGSWIFPFSIPFPTQVDLSTIRAVYPSEDECPVRFLPEPLHEGSPLTPFDLDGDTMRIQPNLPLEPVGPSNITPFDMRAPNAPIEKGRPVFSPPSDPPTQPPRPGFAPISPPSPVAPSASSVEPYTYRPSEESNSPPPSPDYATKPGRSHPPHQVSTAHPRRQPRGATSMQDPELPTSATGHPLPQSFLERDVLVNIQYELTLVIAHGRFSTKSR